MNKQSARIKYKLSWGNRLYHLLKNKSQYSPSGKLLLEKYFPHEYNNKLFLLNKTVWFTTLMQILKISIFPIIFLLIIRHIDSNGEFMNRDLITIIMTGIALSIIAIICLHPHYAISTRQGIKGIFITLELSNHSDVKFLISEEKDFKLLEKILLDEEKSLELLNFLEFPMNDNQRVTTFHQLFEPFRQTLKMD